MYTLDTCPQVSLNTHLQPSNFVEDRGEDAVVDDDVPASDISERHKCYVSGQCQVWLFVINVPSLMKFLNEASFQEYSLNFKQTADADACHKFCGKQNEACNWWSFEPAQSLCVLFGNCTENGEPDKIICEDCISGERL